jgi:hypothetical protein
VRQVGWSAEKSGREGLVRKAKGWGKRNIKKNGKIKKGNNRGDCRAMRTNFSFSVFLFFCLPF